MSYKPSNEELIAYLYGELSEENKAQIDQYFEEHPEARSELSGLEETQVLLGEWEDEEAPAMPGFLQPHRNEEWLYWRKYVAIAASILLLITFGKVMGFQAGYGENGLYLGFGEIQQGLSEAEVRQMLLADRESVLDYVNENVGNMQERVTHVDSELQGLQVSLENRELNTPDITGFTDAEVNQMLDEQKQEFLQQMADHSSKLTEEYRGIFKELYVDLRDNLEIKRLEDLNTIQAAFSNLESATEERQEEIEDAIFDLSREVNNIIESQNSNEDDK